LRSQEHGGQAATLEDQWRTHASETEKLKDTLRQLSNKIEEAKRKRNLLIARSKRAAAQKRIHETMAGLADRSSFEAFERMAERIEDAEMRALAAAEVDEELGGDDLERQFKRLEGGDIDVERRLAALKEEMGLLPAGDPEAGAGGEVREAEIIAEEDVDEEVAEEDKAG
jgi:phage shock protein A